MTHATVAPAGETFALSDAVELVETVRNGFVESVHFGHVVAVDRTGQVLLAAGDVVAPMLPRSTNKFVQAAAMVRLGLGLDGRLLQEGLVLVGHGSDVPEQRLGLHGGDLLGAGRLLRSLLVVLSCFSTRDLRVGFRGVERLG